MTAKTKTVYLLLQNGEPHTQPCTLNEHADVVACDTLEGARDALATWIGDDGDAQIVEATLSWDTQRCVRSNTEHAETAATCSSHENPL